MTYWWQRTILTLVLMGILVVVAQWWVVFVAVAMVLVWKRGLT